MARRAASSSSSDGGPVDELIAAGLDMYARGDVDGALAVWQEALALAPGDSRAMGYVDYVVSNYQVLRKPTVAEASSDGMEFADETSNAGLAVDGMGTNYQRTTVDDGWFLDDDMGAGYAAVVDPRGAASPSEPPPPLPEENEFLAPSATVDAPGVARQLAQHAPAGEGGNLDAGGGSITVPPPTRERPAVFPEASDEDAAMLEARLRGARHTLAPGSVPPVAEIMRSLRPRLHADEVESPDRFSRPTAPPMSATLEATAAALLAPSDDPLIGDTTAEVQYAPEPVEDFPTGPMSMPLPKPRSPSLRRPRALTPSLGARLTLASPPRWILATLIAYITTAWISTRRPSHRPPRPIARFPALGRTMPILATTRWS
ncbi:MAG: tetratricopeptide repeat protein [Myxococcales bacterium]|nr:tetratricopeptide repeat protein [Myxococcales bacterium]